MIKLNHFPDLKPFLKYLLWAYDAPGYEALDTDFLVCLVVDGFYLLLIGESESCQKRVIERNVEQQFDKGYKDFKKMLNVLLAELHERIDVPENLIKVLTDMKIAT